MPAVRETSRAQSAYLRAMESEERYTGPEETVLLYETRKTVESWASQKRMRGENQDCGGPASIDEASEAQTSCLEDRFSVSDP